MDQLLRVFTTVAEQKSFTRAAEHLHMTQPAVSHYIRLLEQKMDVKLLERTNKYVRLTKVGEMIYHQAIDILGRYTRMERSVDDIKFTARGPLLIGSSYTYGEYYLPYKLATILQSYPLLEPTITIKNSHKIIDLLRNHHIDIGIIEGSAPDEEESIKVIPFAHDHLSIVVPYEHSLAYYENLSPSLLREETWLLREEGSGTREVQEKGFHQLGFSPKKSIILGSTQAIKGGIEAGLGISLLSEGAVRNELEVKKAITLDVTGFPLERTFSLITLQMAFYTKAIEILIEQIVGREHK